MDLAGSDPFIPRSQRSTLTANGISFLLKHEPQLLPDISEKELKDKSKAGSLTKFVACIQATWFCLSCITRISQKLPVSMLEINTFAHALCTVVAYILWWRKRFDIEQPFVIREDRMTPLLAYMWMASVISSLPQPHDDETTSYRVGTDTEFGAIIDDKTSGVATANGSEVLNTAQTAAGSSR